MGGGGGGGGGEKEKEQKMEGEEKEGRRRERKKRKRRSTRRKKRRRQKRSKTLKRRWGKRGAGRRSAGGDPGGLMFFSQAPRALTWPGGSFHVSEVGSLISRVVFGPPSPKRPRPAYTSLRRVMQHYGSGGGGGSSVQKLPTVNVGRLISDDYAHKEL